MVRRAGYEAGATASLSVAKAASAVRFACPVLVRIRSTCFSTVRGDRYSRLAISLFVRPSASAASAA